MSELHAWFAAVKDKPCYFPLTAEVLFRQNKTSMNAERQEGGESGSQQRIREVKHGADREGRKENKAQEPCKTSCCVKTSSGKKQTLSWTSFVLMSFHCKTGIKLLHRTSLCSTDAGYQTLSMCCGRVHWWYRSRCDAPFVKHFLVPSSAWASLLMSVHCSPCIHGPPSVPKGLCFPLFPQLLPFCS